MAHLDRYDAFSNGTGLVALAAAVAIFMTTHLPMAPGAAPTAEPMSEIAIDVAQPEAPPAPAEPPPPEPAPPPVAAVEPPPPAVVEPPPPPVPLVTPTGDLPPPKVEPKQQVVQKPPPKKRIVEQEPDDKPKVDRAAEARARRAEQVRRERAAEARSAAHTISDRPAARATPRFAAPAGNAGAFRSCLAGAPYPTSKEARLQKPAGTVGIAVSGGGVSVTRSSGFAILDSAARSRAAACASAAGGGSLTGIVVFHPG